MSQEKPGEAPAKEEMTDPTPEFEEKVRLAFAQAEPARVFCGCKVANEDAQVFVRVYSQRAGSGVIPTPYQVFRFDPERCLLTVPTKEEAARYSIPNYR